MNGVRHYLVPGEYDLPPMWLKMLRVAGHVVGFLFAVLFVGLMFFCLFAEVLP